MSAEQFDIVSRLDDHGRRLEALEASQGNIMKAFPAGDVEGHRRYHELMMEQLEERRRLRRAIQEKTISGLVWSMIVFLLISVWRYLMVVIGKGPT